MGSDEINSRVRGAMCGDPTPAFKLWCDVTTIYSADSPPALGCLLALVREAWGSNVTTHHNDRGATSRPWSVDIAPDGIVPMGATEAEALVAALEVAGGEE